MVDSQFDISQKLKKLFDLKQKQRLAAKEYYRKLLYNPHRPVNDGIPFDPAVQRYGAMSAYHIEFYKPSGKHFLGWCCLLGSIALLTLHVHYTKEKEEELLRSGKVKYTDRKYKMFF